MVPLQRCIRRRGGGLRNCSEGHFNPDYKSISAQEVTIYSCFHGWREGRHPRVTPGPPPPNSIPVKGYWEEAPSATAPPPPLTLNEWENAEPVDDHLKVGNRHRRSLLTRI